MILGHTGWRKRANTKLQLGFWKGATKRSLGSFPNSLRVSAGPEHMALCVADKCRAQTEAHCPLPMMCRRLKEDLLKIIIIMQVMSYLEKADPCWPTLSRARFQGVCPAVGRAHTKYFTLSHLLLPVPTTMAGWDQGGCLARKGHFSLFIYFSIKLTSPHKSQTSDSALLGIPWVWHCTLQDILLATNFPIFNP